VITFSGTNPKDADFGLHQKSKCTLKALETIQFNNLKSCKLITKISQTAKADDFFQEIKQKYKSHQRSI